MADDLLPSISSDEEDDEDVKEEDGSKLTSQSSDKDSSAEQTKTNSKKKKQKKSSKKSVLDDDDDDDQEDAAMNRSFEFGGILGEDGGFNYQDTLVGWSYETALKSMQSKDAADPAKPVVPPRMNVASLIAAKRKEQQQKQKNKMKPTTIDEDDENGNEDGDGENGSSDDNEEEELDETSNQDEVDDDDNDGDSDDDSDGEDDEEELDRQKALGDDVLTTRTRGKYSPAKTDAKVQSDDAEGNSDDDDSEDESADDPEEAAKAATFFDDNPDTPIELEEIQVFAQLTLSRPILRGIAAMGFVKPTPIQAAVIPLALQGRDICASAVTGSGKTAAFLLPLLERLLHRPLNSGIKAVLLTPTRELAAQGLGMLTTLAKFTKLRPTLIVGGAKNVNAQAAELRTRPNIVIATPGRLLDHVTNSQGVYLEDVEFLVLDEADRLLDLGFRDEVHEIIKHLPSERQTLLFSATMNTKVDELIKLSLKRPVRVHMSEKKSGRKNPNDLEVAPRLEQEFVRVRPSQEGVTREGMLLALLTRTFKKQTIVFFDLKATAHRLMILCGLCGLKCTELHGNLTQQQRLTALEDFRSGEVDILLATDLAARGLDIDRVESVVNFEMPNQVPTYIHRIGRTARAGRGGRSCTLIGEGRRQLMKELIRDAQTKTKKRTASGPNPDGPKSKYNSGVIRSRTIPPAVISHFAGKIASLEGSVKEILAAEAVAKMDRIAEMEAQKAMNLIEHSDAIMARPRKEWFASTKEKEERKLAAAERKKLQQERAGTGTHRMTRKKRRKREALAALNEPDDHEDQGDTERPKSNLKMKIKSDARSQKRKAEEAANAKMVKSVFDTDVEREKAAAKRAKKRAASDAAGDASLFAEEKVAFSPKEKKSNESVASSAYHFRGYDPDRKLGKKKGRKSFKSKAKYKRK